jgi:hypothetical protein
MSDTEITTKKVKLGLKGIDGNAFVILGAFRRQAAREGWTEEEINSVTEAAKGTHSYEGLLATIMEHCVNPLSRYKR